MNFIPQFAHEVYPRTLLKAGGDDKQPKCCSLCGGHKDDAADTVHLATDRRIEENPR